MIIPTKVLVGVGVAFYRHNYNGWIVPSQYQIQQQKQYYCRIYMSSTIDQRNEYNSQPVPDTTTNVNGDEQAKINNNNNNKNEQPNKAASTSSPIPLYNQQPLQEFDPEMYNLIQKEDERQNNGLELIASENFCSRAVRDVLGSCLTNKYSEGLPYARYYGGNQYIDQIEVLCIERALQLFQLNHTVWGVNVQPYSGSPANFATYTALLQPHDRIMGLDLPSGGHLTHGYQTKKGKKVSATSIYFESMPYIVNPQTGYIDYDDVQYRVQMFQPKLLIAGGSAYPREWDYQRLRTIADSVNAILMVDMAHISGLVAANVVQTPFPYADIVTSTTHKTLRGPRSGLIFAKKQYMDQINAAVFPSLQGGPHNHQIGALAVALHEAQQPEFRIYAEQILRNAQALVYGLQRYGHILATNGTDNHLLLWDVRSSSNHTLSGSKMEKLYELVGITTNKNSIAGDTSALNPGGIRLGTPALTTRGFTESDFEYVAELLHLGFTIAMDIEFHASQKQLSNDDTNSSPKIKSSSTLKEFITSMMEDDTKIQPRIHELRMKVEQLAKQFPIP